MKQVENCINIIATNFWEKLLLDQQKKKQMRRTA